MTRSCRKVTPKFLLLLLLGTTSSTLSFQTRFRSSQRTRKTFAPKPFLYDHEPSLHKQISPIIRQRNYNSFRNTLHSSINSPDESTNASQKASTPDTHPPGLSSPSQTFINALLLLACFGYAIYTILDIDHGMTRGWSQAEILTRIPFDNWRSYEDSLSESPIFTKTAINVIIYLLGDWLSQTLFQKRNVLDFDALRTMRNGLIGLCFGPLVHEYYEFSDKILPVDVGINRVYKIFMDQTIYLSVKCSIYIMAVGVLNGSTFDEAKENVKEKIIPIMFTAWRFWPLVHCVTYGFIPARHRILWVNCVDLVWNAILALKASAKDDGEGKDTDEFSGEGNLEVNILNEPVHDELKEFADVYNADVAPLAIIGAEVEDTKFELETATMDIDVLHETLSDEILAANLSQGMESYHDMAPQMVGANSTAEAG